MTRRGRRRHSGWLAVWAVFGAVVVSSAQQTPPPGAQPGGRPGGPGGRGGPPPTARASAPFDITGYWVSLVTEDWRWRMMTPPKGDYSSVPLNGEGRRVADSWDLAKDKADGNECRAFGAAGVMRRPGRLHITWENDSAITIETSAGNQTRLLRFAQPQSAAATVATGERTWQGTSIAEWRKQQPVFALGFGGRGRGPVAGGNLKVVTTGLRAGYLRTNGVPYSEKALVTEYYYRHSGPRDLEWLTVTTIVDDPTYLAQPFITSTDFRKEPDGSKFTPTPCAIDPPRLAKAP
jgi:hypothetical protein